ncbi:MAG: mannose-1-phosphate guanylyltransferase [Bacteroidales bacterium]|nr:mannose-1-phosphate guanylyltransferase [Bacteroidales bacterium]
MNKNNYCVIMAGGIGSRFWPLSRTLKPKQFIDILGIGKTLLQQTFDRFRKICPVENIIIVTNADYKDIVLEQLPELSSNQLLLEPSRRNTAPCIAYANFKILKLNPNANIIVAPSDHLILKENKFIKIINQGVNFVENNDALLTLGIKPSKPETGYGYIQINNDIKVSKNKNLKKVKTFTEKPDYEMAKVFLESGEFFWNSGIFLWSLKSIIKAFENYLPEVNSLFTEGIETFNTEKEEDFINKTYSNCKNISIDYGIMEKADNVFVLCSDFGWSDLGTWGSLYEHSKLNKDKNAIRGNNVITYDTSNCIINVSDDKLVVLQGLDDYIFVESEGIILVCNKKDEQQIRQFVNDIKIKKGGEYI